MDHLANRFPQLATRLHEVSERDGAISAIRATAVDWNALLDRWVDGLDLQKHVALAVSGLGDGSHIARLMERMPSGCCVFCGEADLGVAKRFCESELGKSVR